MRIGVLALAAAMLMLSGCWGLRDISELALVMAVGIDRTEAGEVLVTVQIARPAPGSGTPGGARSEQAPIRVVSAEAPTVFEAIRRLASTASRRLMWAHNQIIVLGWSLAAHDVTEAIDFFTRNPELRYRTLVALAEGEARELLAEQTGLESIPGVSMSKMFRYSTLLGVARLVDVKEFAATTMAGERSPTLPVLYMSNMLAPGVASEHNRTGEIALRGRAVFREGRVVAQLSPAASRGLLIAEKKLRRTVLSVPCPTGVGRPSTVEVIRADSRLAPTITGPGRVRFDLTVSVEAALTSLGCPVNYRDAAILNRMESDLRKRILLDLESLLAEARESRTDPIGLGNHLRAYIPDLWRRLGPKWPEAAGDVPVRLHVTAHLVGSEVLLQPPPRRQGGGSRE